MALLIIGLALSISNSAYALSGGFSITPTKIVINQTTSLVKESVLLLGTNTTEYISVSASPNILFSNGNIVLPTNGSSTFSFYVNASTPGNYSVLFSSNTSKITLPIEVKSVQASGLTNITGGYTIETIGNIAPYSTASFLVYSNGNLVLRGTLFVEYQYVSSSGNVSSFASGYNLENSPININFPNIFGNVILKYITPSGQVGALQVIPISNSSILPTSKPNILLYCNLPTMVPNMPYNLSAQSNSPLQAIEYYSANTFENFSCSVYSPDLQQFIPGVIVTLTYNGVPIEVQETNYLGLVQFVPPKNGYPAGTLQLSVVSNKYQKAFAYISVSNIPNPLTVVLPNGQNASSVNYGNELIIYPIINQLVTVKYPNGSIFKQLTSNPIVVRGIGKFIITGSAPGYTTFSQTIIMKSIPLTIVALNTPVYYYIPNEFETEYNGTLYKFNGTVFGIHFVNGMGYGYITPGNASSISDYTFSFAFPVLPPKVSTNLPAHPPINQIITAELVSNSTLVPYTGTLIIKQGDATSTIEVRNGQFNIEFANTDPVEIVLQNSSFVAPFTQVVYPVNAYAGKINTFILISIIVIILILVIAFIIKRGGGNASEGIPVGLPVE
jgi:hypothetical protein